MDALTLGIISKERGEGFSQNSTGLWQIMCGPLYFLILQQSFLHEGTFDHSPTVLKLYRDEVAGRMPFRYFNMWATYDDFVELVQGVWHVRVQRTKMYQIV